MDEDLFSAERKERLLILDGKRRQLLKVQEETMRQKSRAVWLKDGDSNSKLFHQFPNHRRNTNSLWGLKDSKGDWCVEAKGLKKDVVDFFWDIFSKPASSSLLDQLKVIIIFPNFLGRKIACRLVSR